MTPITHGLLAWLLAFIFIKKVNDRRLICIAGVIPDMDGNYILFNEHLYYKYHHTWGHSYIFAMFVVLFLVVFAKDKKRVAPVAFGAFTLHLFADIIGSNWEVYPLYPFSKFSLTSPSFLSDFMIYNVINPTVFLLAMVAVFYIMFKKGITPMEFISVNLDKRMVSFFKPPIKYKCEICGTLSYFECSKCGKKVCSRHKSGIIKPKCSLCLENKKKEKYQEVKNNR